MKTSFNFNDFHRINSEIYFEEEEEDYILCRSPERKLLVAILERAILDLHHKKKGIRKSAELWFGSEDSKDTAFSYQYICNFLNFDPVEIKKLSYKRRKDILLKNKYK